MQRVEGWGVREDEIAEGDRVETAMTDRQRLEGPDERGLLRKRGQPMLLFLRSVGSNARTTQVSADAEKRVV